MSFRLFHFTSLSSGFWRWSGLTLESGVIGRQPDRQTEKSLKDKLRNIFWCCATAKSQLHTVFTVHSADDSNHPSILYLHARLPTYTPFVPPLPCQPSSPARHPNRSHIAPDLRSSSARRWPFACRLRCDYPLTRPCIQSRPSSGQTEGRCRGWPLDRAVEGQDVGLELVIDGNALMCCCDTRWVARDSLAVDSDGVVDNDLAIGS